MSVIENLLNKRKQVRQFSEDKIPNLEDVNRIINKAYDLVASKQSLVPYKITVLGPHKKEEKQELYNLSVKNDGGHGNENIFAPYVLCFTNRLVDNPNLSVKRKIAKGHQYDELNPLVYRKKGLEVGIEVGMFSKILTSLCMEHGFDVSYLLCFSEISENKNPYSEKKPVISFLKDRLLFSMQIGYQKTGDLRKKWLKDFDEYKPDVIEIVEWL
tara:strand:+ start:70 stop:711 length:642 start_codon:yes stop_codon:yes gene_type:complete